MLSIAACFADNVWFPGALAPSWLALLPPNVEKPKGEFVWHDKTIVDWVTGPMPALD